MRSMAVNSVSTDNDSMMPFDTLRDKKKSEKERLRKAGGDTYWCLVIQPE